MKKLNLDELALKLPKIDEKNSKILLGGSYGNDDSAFNPDNTLNEGNSSNNQQSTNNIPDDYSDGNYDLDYSQDDQYQDADDYSYDQDGDVQNNGNNGNGTSTIISEAAILANFPESFFDGSSPQNYSFNLSAGNDNFTNQLMTILQSNSIIRTDLAGFFNNQYVHLNFDVADINSPAHTTYDDDGENYHIVFDTDNVGVDGFIGLSGTDNVGYSHAGLTDAQSLVIVVAHEMMHAKHFAVWSDAVESQGSILGARLWLIENDYDLEFVDVFSYVTIDANGNPVGNYHEGDALENNMHDFMQNNNHPVFDAILEEFNDDVDALNMHLINLQSEYIEALNELANTNWQVEDAQEEAELEHQVEYLEEQIEYIQENYSWMFD